MGIRRLLVLGLLCGLLVSILGCAFGRDQAGNIVGGVKLGSLPETAGELASAAAGFLPAPWNMLASAGVGLLGLGGTAAAAHYRSAKVSGDKAWDDATAHASASALPIALATAVASLGQRGAGVDGSPQPGNVGVANVPVGVPVVPVGGGPVGGQPTAESLAAASGAA